MGKLKTFLNSPIIKKDVGEETVLSWKETLSYALGRGAQGMNTGMTSSKYVNYFLTNVLFSRLERERGAGSAMKVAGRIRFYCGIFDAINDPVMGVIVDRTRTKNGQMRPYIKWAPLFVALVMVLFFLGSSNLPTWFNIVYTMFGVSSIVRSVGGAIPMVFVAGAGLLPYFKDHRPQSYLTSAIIAAAGIIILTRLTYANTHERAEHKEDAPSVKECFRLLFKNRPLLMLFLGNIFFVLCKIPEQVSTYFVYDLMSNDKYNLFIDVIKFPGSLIAAVAVPMIMEKLGRRADPKKFYQACCVLAIALSALFALTTCKGLLGKENGESVSLFTGVLVVLFTGLLAIPMEFKNLIQKEMEAETVDYIEYKTGTRVEGVMLSIMSFTGKIENTFSSTIGLRVLGLTGYISHEEGSIAQNAATNKALFLMTVLVPALGYLLMLLPMHFYNITGESHRKMMEEIKERRAALAAEQEV